MMGETKGIDEQADEIRSSRIQHNWEILSPITKTVILTGRQNISLRGHRDDSQHYLSSNPGNFQALLNFRVDSGNTKLEKHFESGNKNATYRSKTTQNKLIKIRGDQIREQIVAEITIVAVLFIQFLKTKQRIVEVLSRCQLFCAMSIPTKKLMNASLNSCSVKE